MKLMRHVHILLLSFFALLLFGCSDGHKQESPADISSKELFKETAFSTLSIEDQYEAEKLLEEAAMHIGACRKIRGKSPQKGILAARQVLEEFPNTEYAQQARELLRRVPSRWKERHGLTDEELGY